MRKTLKRIAIWSGLLLFLLLGAAFALSSIFEEEIGTKIITAVNEGLTSELSVENFKLSLIRGFPSASASLQGVVVADNQGGILLEVEEIDFRIGLSSIFGSKLKLNSVLINNGALTILIDKNGKPNYDIVKSSETEESGESSNMAVQLKKAQLNDIEVIYADEQANQALLVQVDQLSLAGEFSSSRFALNSKASMESRFFEMDETRYFVGKPIAYEALIDVDMEQGNYEFKKVVLRLANNEFDLDGYIRKTEEGRDFDLQLTSEDSDLEAVVQLLPAEYLQYIGDLSSNGTFFLEGMVKGRQTASDNPDIDFKFGLENGKVTSSLFADPLKDVSFLAHFSNGKFRDARSTFFELKDFKGYFNRELLELHLKVTDLNDPEIDFRLDGAFPLSATYKMFGMSTITDGDGEIEIRNLAINGHYKDMIRSNRIHRVKAGGEIGFDDASLTINGEEMIADRGELILDGNTLAVRGLKIEGAGSELTLDGSVFNLLPVLLADSLNTRQAFLSFEAKLAASQLDIDRLINLGDYPATTTNEVPLTTDSLKVAKVQRRERLVNYLSGVFDADIQSFNFNEIQGTDFKGKLRFDDGQMLIQGSTNAMGGYFKLDGDLFFEEEPRLQARLDCKGIDVKEFFRQAENFGQSTLEARHVSGTLNSKMAIFANFAADGSLKYDDLLVFAGIGIEDGELEDFEMLESFSSYVKVQDLQRIKLVNMQNWMQINKGVLYLPSMFIQSNAMNLKISGEHTFSNEMEYYLQVNAAQVVGNKFKKYNPELEPIPAKEKGFVNLYFKIFGTLDQYEYETAKKDVKQAFARSEYRKSEIKAALAKAFEGDIQLIEAPSRWDDIPEYKENWEEEEVEFLEGFGDGDK